ncbi:hypothetical protein AWQ22_02145 [Picosynechococcus sp. PCC 7117]|nr:hypothetical protein AWQ22_02145 [Picosynechococcus sp. PCC 7117]
MLTDYDSYLEFRDRLEFELLLDIAHLKVSVNSLKLDFAEQFGTLFNHTNYIHISENDGFHDQNRGFNQDSKTLDELRAYDFRSKTITLEIYRKLESIQQDYEIVKKVLKLEN